MVEFWSYFNKSIFFESFKWGIIFMDFVGFPSRTSKLKNDIRYIKYKFSHRFEKVWRWLNIYYSNIKIVIFFKVITMSIWIILKNLVWTFRECNFNWYWATIACIYPHVSKHKVSCQLCVRYIILFKLHFGLMSFISCIHVLNHIKIKNVCQKHSQDSYISSWKIFF